MEFELNILRWIQKITHPVWTAFFEAVSFLGEPLILTAIFCFIYWSVDKKKGLFLGYSVVLSLTLNGLVKDIFRLERPIGKPGIQSHRLETATGYSFPSGHTQSTASFWSSIALIFKRRWLWILAGVLIFLVGLSRMYLGVHYPKDVLAGLLLGVISSILLWKLYERWGDTLAFFFVSLLLFLPAEFLFHSRDFYKAIGLLAGLVAGVWFERRFVHFLPAPTTWRKILRWSVGLAVMGAVAGILKAGFPEGVFFLHLRYALVGFTAVGGFPWIFNKWNF